MVRGHAAWLVVAGAMAAGCGSIGAGPEPCSGFHCCEQSVDSEFRCTGPDDGGGDEETSDEPEPDTLADGACDFDEHCPAPEFCNDDFECETPNFPPACAEELEFEVSPTPPLEYEPVDAVLAADFDGLPGDELALAAGAVVLVLDATDTWVSWDEEPAFPGEGVFNSADFDGDGAAELAIDVLGMAESEALILDYDGLSLDSWGSIDPGGVVYSAAAASDFDGDGFADLVVAGGLPGAAGFRGNGDGTFGAATLPGFTANAVAVGDFDGDDVADVALNADALQLWTFADGFPGTTSAVHDLPRFDLVESARLGADSASLVEWRRLTNTGNSLLRISTLEAGQPQIEIHAVPDWIQGLQSFDLDGDGVDELVWRNQYGELVVRGLGPEEDCITSTAFEGMPWSFAFGRMPDATPMLAIVIDDELVRYTLP